MEVVAAENHQKPSVIWSSTDEVAEYKQILRVKRNIRYAIVGILLFIISAFSYGIYWLAYDMDRLPEGEYLTEATSPAGTYTVKAYRTNGGATTAFAIRGELVFNKQKRDPQNIYWNYREDQAEINWLDDDRVVINGHELHVPHDRFDFRRQN
ncbi:hypothetical protein GTO89_12085 [Heliobacterium gestii]|uniref:DUF5412 domain-containing protein n=2 Tax=Heliomicrobium gestii TaxID=2699 RepID=A0A845LK58_HELGE|nr:hypothetical protein [Heliomicrobium gestii]